MKSPAKRGSRYLAGWVSLLIGASFSRHVHGQSVPTGGVVTSGNAVIETAGDHALAIRQQSARSVIRWQDFSIAQGARVDFHQPGRDAATLNIVDGNSVSTLAGTLTADGSVFLVNRNGIAITPDGLIDVRGGFVASTLSISEEDFMSGRFLFNGRGGVVANQGTIRTGDGGIVALLGSSVRNDGYISAPLGKIAFGAGERMTLDLNGDGFLQVLLPTELAEDAALVDHSGRIDAPGGSVVLKAEAVRKAWRDVVNVPGEIRATSVSSQNGRIVLSSGSGDVRVSGTLDVSAEQGAERAGTIDITGENVTLAGATLDATAPLEGGRIRIGGEFQGGKPGSTDSPHAARFGSTEDQPSLASSTTTTIDAASVIDVSATGENGRGGSVVLWSEENTRMDGALRATGEASGGAVEISSAAQVQSVALNRVELGKGGLLLLDPKDIQIDGYGSGPDGSIDFGTDPSGTTHLNTDDLVNLLSAGTNVALRASNDIYWDATDRLQVKVERPAPDTPAGNLELIAGRSVTLDGTFETGGGAWSIVANAPAALGVIDEYREEGPAYISASWAEFINDTGPLSFTLADGAGNTHRSVDGISVGSIRSGGLTIDIAPDAVGEWDEPWITLTRDLNVSGDVTLTGNLRISSPDLTIRGHRVTWTNETTAGLVGEGKLRFFENDVLTRYGWIVGSEIVRMELGGGSFTRVYGDSEATIVQTSPPVRESEYTPVESPDDVSALLLPGSLKVSDDPGVTAPVGTHTVIVSATNDFGIDTDVASSGYFFNLTPVSAPLTITPRTVTATVSNGAYTYGSPEAVVTLHNVVNGDALLPVATLDGTPNTVLQALSGGFGFDARVGAGSHGFTVTGITGAAASNYVFDAGGAPSGMLTISQKAITYRFNASGLQEYGTLGSLPASILDGYVLGDSVLPVTSLFSSGSPIAHDARLKVGQYDVVVTGLTGEHAGNYYLAASGNQTGVFTVTPKPLTWSVGESRSTYGSLPTSFGALSLYGVLPDDDVSAIVGPYGFTPAEKTPVGTYTTAVVSLTGADAGNYTLALSGNQYGTHVVEPKPITWTFSDVTSIYGEPLSFGSVTLHGVLDGDSVWVTDRAAFRDGERVEINERTPAGVYEQRVTAVDNPNYVPAATAENPGTITITPRRVLYELPSYTYTYGDTPSSLPFVATFWNVLPWDQGRVFAGEIGIASGETLGDRLSAGTYSLVMKELRDFTGGNYFIDAESLLNQPILTVNPRPLTWRVGSSFSTYGADTFSLPPVFPDTPFAETDLTFEVAITDAQGRPFTTRSLPGNYVSRVVALGGSAASNYVLQAEGSTPGVHVHNPRPVYFQVPDLTVTYGDWFTLPSATLTNVLPGDNVYAGSTLISGGLDPRSRLDAGTYILQVDSLLGPDALKYQLLGGSGTLTIQPRVLTVDDLNLPRLGGMRVPQSAVYGDLYRSASDPLFGTGRVLELTFKDYFAGGNLLDGDDVTTLVREPTIGVSTSGAYAAGQYEWRLAGGLLGKDAHNYVFDFDPSLSLMQLSISPRPIEVWTGVQSMAGETASRVRYGDGPDYELFSRFWETDALRYARRTVLPGDDVKSPEARLEAPDGLLDHVPERLRVGTYSTRIEGGLSGSDAGNYVIDVVHNSSVEIFRRPLAVTVDDRSWTYGPARQVEIADLARTIGLLPGDEIIPVFDFAGRSTVSLTDRLVIDSRTDVGNYYLRPIGISGADADNYNFVPVYVDWYAGEGLLSREGTFSITPRPVAYRPAFSRASFTYGDIVDVSGELEGVLEGDDLWVTLYARSLSEPSLTALANRPLLNAGEYAVTGTLSGADAHNYVLEGPNGRSADALAYLEVLPRTLKIESISMRSVYTQVGTPEVVYSGLLPGQSLRLAYTYRDPHGFQVLNNGRPSAGTYTIQATIDGITGSRLSNYVLDPDSKLTGTWIVEPLTIDLGLTSQSAVYGDGLFLLTLGGTYDYSYYDTGRGEYITRILERPELELTPDVSRDFKITKSNTFGRDPITYRVDPTVEVGTYNVSFQLKDTPLRNNLRLINNTLTVTIVPRPLTLELLSEHSTVYGGYFGTLTGVVNKDDIGVVIDFLADGSNSAISDVLKPDSAGRLVLTNREEVGDYTWSTKGLLSGSRARNYVVDVVGADSGTLTLTPRPIRWQVDQHKVQYGNFQICESGGCFPWNPGGYGQVHFDSLVPGDVLGSSALQVQMQLIDFDGNFLSLDSTTPLGQYLQVVTGLTGTKAHNYVFAGEGNLPGLLEVVPAWLNYKIDSGVFVGGLGLYGATAGTVRWYQNSTELPNLNLVPIVEAWYYGDPSDKLASDFSNLKVGEYHFKIIGLTGPDADKYRLVTSDLTHSAAKPTIGKLFVFADTSFGLQFVGQGDLPPPPRVTTSTDTYAGTSVGYTGVGAGAGAGASATVDLGDVDLTASARATTEALAKVGAGNIQVKATADGRLEIRVDSGPGYGYAGAGGSAQGGLEIGRTGLVVGGQAKAGVDAGGGASGSLGAAGDGAVDGNVGVFVYARSQNKYGYKDGKVTASFDQGVGVGASVGVSGSLSGSVGSIGGGVTVYTPGSLAAKFDFGAGLDGDRLNVDLGIGLSFLVGGLAIDFDFSIDVSWTRDIACFFGSCPEPSPPPPPSPDQVLMERLVKLADTQKQVQAKLLELLRTDPQAAAQYIESWEFRDAANEFQWILRRADDQGYQLINDGGTLKFVKK